MVTNAQVHRERDSIGPTEIVNALDISDLFGLGFNISHISDIWSLKVMLFRGAKCELRLSQVPELKLVHSKGVRVGGLDRPSFIRSSFNFEEAILSMHGHVVISFTGELLHVDDGCRRGPQHFELRSLKVLYIFVDYRARACPGSLKPYWYR